MAIFKRLTKEQIKQDFDHYGMFMGIVPIYVVTINVSVVSPFVISGLNGY